MNQEKTLTYLDGELSSQEIQSLNDSPIMTIIEDDTATLSGHFTDKEKLFLHMTVKKRKLTKTMLLDWKELFLDIMDEFKRAGHEYVYSTIPDSDKKAFKFNVCMGFVPFGIVENLADITSTNNKIWILRRPL